MNLDWHTLDRWMMGEAWTGAQIQAHLYQLCDHIGPRWSSSDGEWAAIHCLREQVERASLDQVAEEAYEIDTWSWSLAKAQVVEDGAPTPPPLARPAARLAREPTDSNAGAGPPGP
jgi:hypothetical protein